MSRRVRSPIRRLSWITRMTNGTNRARTIIATLSGTRGSCCATTRVGSPPTSAAVTRCRPTLPPISITIRGVVREPLDHEGDEERRALEGPTKRRLREKDLDGNDRAEHQHGVDRADQRANERGAAEHAPKQRAAGGDNAEDTDEEAEAAPRGRSHQTPRGIVTVDLSPR